MACLLSASDERTANRAASSIRVVVIHFSLALRLNDRDHSFTRYNDHLHPAKFIVDTACIDLRQFDIIGHDVSNFIQWLFILAPCIDLPDATFVKRLTSLWDCYLIHAEIPL